MRPAPLLAALLFVVAGLVLPSTAPAGSEDLEPSTADANASAEEPLDPEGPWVVSAQKVRLTGGPLGTLELKTPVSARANDSPVDRIVVTSPEGRPLVGLACEDGACQVRTPLEIREVPAATLRLEGPWHQGRLTGVTLVAAEGGAVASVDAFGPHGVRVTGAALGDPITVTSVLVLEGDPRDVDRLALRGPDGSPRLVFSPGGEGVGTVRAGQAEHRFDEVQVALHGDPLTEDEILLRVHLDGERYGLWILQTPADAFRQAGRALEDHLIVRSPTRDHAARALFAAGPVQLEGAGTISPRFDLRTRWTLSNGSAYDRGWLLVDGQPRAQLELSGQRDGERVLFAVLPDGSLEGPRHDLAARLERDLAPGVVQVHRTDAVPIATDRSGPSPPSPRVEDGRLVWAPRADVSHWEARARPAGGGYRMLPVDGTQVEVPTTPTGRWEGQVRGIDPVGNPGPWSQPVSWIQEGEDAARETGLPHLVLRSPVTGARLSGLSEVVWVPDDSIARVEVAVSLEDSPTWTWVARGTHPPVGWDTRTVPDGDHELRIVAVGSGGRTSQIVPVHVDNLDEAYAIEGPLGTRQSSGTDAGSPASAMPGRPLPRAVATGLVLTGVGVALARLAPGKGRAK